MNPPNIHATSTASAASAGVASACEGSATGTLEASWGERTERSYVGSQDEVGDHKNLTKKWWTCTIRQLMEFRRRSFWDMAMLFASRVLDSKY